MVKAVTQDTVTVDAPIVNAIDKQWGGGYLVRYEFPGRIENVGVEGIRCDSVYASPTDHAHAWRFVTIFGAQNAWVRDCTALHMAYTAVEIKNTAKWVTVQDTKCLDMISEIKGGLRYPFSIIGQLCLVQRCVASEGRHDFVMQYWVPGPNVFLDCRSDKPAFRQRLPPALRDRHAVRQRRYRQAQRRQPGPQRLWSWLGRRSDGLLELHGAVDDRRAAADIAEFRHWLCRRERGG